MARTATTFEGQALRPLMPKLSLNSRGVFAYHCGVLPRQVAWQHIESAHFYRMTSFHDGSELLTVTLKGAGDKTLLTLNPQTFAGAAPAWKQRFVAELKRRLTGDDAT